MWIFLSQVHPTLSRAHSSCLPGPMMRWTCASGASWRTCIASNSCGVLCGCLDSSRFADWMMRQMLASRGSTACPLQRRLNRVSLHRNLAPPPHVAFAVPARHLFIALFERVRHGRQREFGEAPPTRSAPHAEKKQWDTQLSETRNLNEGAERHSEY